MEKFVIQGGSPLSGEIVPAGNKNAALPILAACLLTEEELVLRNVPRISDTETQLALLEGIGVKTLFLELDVTVPIGQFKVRVEAFLEMLSEEDLF